ncbi:MAG: hypothetical protein ACREP9_07830 [Candidatus Dormibacteraceae bacterium]
MTRLGCCLVLALCFLDSRASGQTLKVAYPSMLPVAGYLMPRDAEISLARSAAPRSISENAQILVFTKTGYQEAVKGTNGFVCMVARSWSAGFGDPDFWNPRVRAPICYNAAAALSQVPETIKRTEVALAGRPESQIHEAIEAGFSSGELPVAKAGSLAYMMSKRTYFSDREGHWLPHLMLFVPETPPKSWGAGLPGSPILGVDLPEEHLTVFLIPIGRWSDGTMAAASGK